MLYHNVCQAWPKEGKEAAKDGQGAAKDGAAPTGVSLYQVKRKLLADLAALGSGDAGLAETLNKITEALAESAIRQAKAASGAEMSKTLAARQGVF